MGFRCFLFIKHANFVSSYRRNLYIGSAKAILLPKYDAFSDLEHHAPSRILIFGQRLLAGSHPHQMLKFLIWRETILDLVSPENHTIHVG